MKSYCWSKEKDLWLRENRGVGFDDIAASTFICAINHPSRSHQIILLFEYEKYIWAVPAVINDEGVLFLKTAFPSRKFTAKYKKGELI